MINTPDSIDTVSARSHSGFLPLASRVLLGLIFLVMGLNGFLNFLPQPKVAMPPAVVAFMGGLMGSGYMIQLISGTGVAVAVLLLANRFVPLALAVIASVIVNIVAFHLFLMPTVVAVPGVLAAILEVYLAWTYRDVYRPMLAMRV